MGWLRRLSENFLMKRNQVQYWKNKGVNFYGGGKDIELYPGVDFGSEPYLVEIGNHVRLNKGVTIVTHDGGVWVLRKMKEECKDIDLFRPVHIGNNVHIGHNSIIMPGVHIGDNCIIGCAAVVTHDIPDNSVAVGVPARVIETIEQYEQKHIDEFEHTKYMSRTEKQEYLSKKFGL